MSKSNDIKFICIDNLEFSPLPKAPVRGEVNLEKRVDSYMKSLNSFIGTANKINEALNENK